MSDDPAKSASARCPICRKPADAKLRPFCSRRCAEVDLGRWLGGAYAIPAVDAPDEFEGDDAGPPSNDNRPGGPRRP